VAGSQSRSAHVPATIDEVLQDEYARILHLFERLRQTSGRIEATRERILGLLSREMTALIQAEEEIVYLALLDVLPSEDERILNLMEDHADLRGILWELEQTAADDPRWSERLEIAEGLARHHVTWEECVVIDAVGQYLAVDKSVALGEQLLVRKAEIEFHVSEIQSRTVAHEESRRVGMLLN
jgi:hypothetical protein